MIERGRSTYAGFAATIKLVGTGPRGSRDLTFDEARAAMADLLSGHATDAQAGAFLMAMRLKGEAPAELAGFARALQDAARPLEADTGGRPVVACAGAYDGVAAAPHLSIAAACAAAARGAGVVMHCAGTLGPKRGTTQAQVLADLGGPATPTGEQSAAMLERAGVTLVYTPSVLEAWDRLRDLRDQMGVRGPLHAAERLQGFFGARRYVVGYTHTPFAERILRALDTLQAERAVVVRGVEGSDVARPGRPTAAAGDGPLELPEELGMRMPDAGPGGSAEITRGVLAGELNGPLEQAVALSGGLRLYAAGLGSDPAVCVEHARSALRDGSAAAALDALVG